MTASGTESEDGSLDTWDLWGLGDAVMRTHGPAVCAGQRCVLHNPSEHHMVSWPLRLRAISTLAVWLGERQCEHGQWHADPDAVGHLAKLGLGSLGDHGCDGCCTEDGNAQLRCE